MAVAAAAARTGADAIVLTALDSIAWLLNIRGGDLGETPVARAFLLLRADATATLFIDPDKADAALRAHLGSDVRLDAYEALAATLRGMAGRRVQIDPETCAVAVRDALDHAIVLVAPDPCVAPRAVKNPVEIEGMRRAHVRDGVALARFLCWLEGAVGEGGLDEIAVSDRLEELRREGLLCQGLSAAAISAAGANGALPHYLAKPGQAAPIGRDSVYLFDGGGQYLDGTTDVTRTVAVGAPPAQARCDFTLALKGHLAVAAARFPEGTTGGQLDSLARQPLWRRGLDYATGTGHGLGSYLAIHEGPAFIGRRGGTRPVDEPLLAGMVMTVEPGVYRLGSHGVRTENAYLVVPAVGEGGEPGWLAFEALTAAPIDRRMIDLSLLERWEIDWLDRYHAFVLDAVGPRLDEPTRAWLERACAPLSNGRP